MENLSAEVGHKMRSAVKAKLVEMGNGGNSGYIDDELPDYVMIMVANKRSKQQMTEDLSLFLGDNTSEFVDWLHQVLQKLQEVAIPASAIIQKSKRKTSESKKDKKRKPKKGHYNKDGLDDDDLTPPAATSASPRNATEVSAGTATPSITDVFAEHLIQKARTTQILEKASSVKAKDENASTTPRKPDEFDIPTMSQIAETTTITNNRRKDLSALADLQKKINQAKRQLRAIGSDEESEDEDFINIKDEGEELGGEEGSGSALNDAPKGQNNVQNREKSQRVPITFRENTMQMERDSSVAKRTIMDRLGSRKEPAKEPANKDNIISLSANRRMEKEIYVPVFRRTDDSRKPSSIREGRDARESLREERNTPRESVRNARNLLRDSARDGRDSLRERDLPRESRDTIRESRDTIRERDRELGRGMESRSLKRDHNDKAIKHTSVLQRDLREQVRDKQNKAKEPHARRSSRELSSKHSRAMESRVIVAPVKPSYDENVVEVPVNSVVKVQPRPVVPSNKQACKNLLLRAVAEAQRSTASVKLRDESPKKRKTDNISPDKPKLFTKSFRDKIKQNIVIEVDTTSSSNAYGEDDDSDEVEFLVENIGYHEIQDDTEEDVVEDMDDQEEHSSLTIDGEDNIDYETNDVSKNPTQFVVTLDDLRNCKYAAKSKAKYTEKARPIGVANGDVDMENEDSIGEHSKSGSTSSPLTVEKSSQKVNKLIIKNDTDDEEELRKEVQKSTPPTKPPTPTEETKSASPPPRSTKRRHVSPINFDIKKEEPEEQPDAAPTKRHRSSENRERSSSATRRPSEERPSESARLTTKRNDVRKKYENLPSLASTIISASDELSAGSAARSKSLDRCKYYPSCGKGDNCEFHHPVSSCKQFPNCKFGDQCLYFHPKCKFDLTCNRHGCNFSHSPAVTGVAPPLSSHVVPVTNYKSITNASLPMMCRFYPNCANTQCVFFHPKPCRFGRNCTNKIECNFYHFETASSTSSAALGGGGAPGKDKMKWFASSTVY